MIAFILRQNSHVQRALAVSLLVLFLLTAWSILVTFGPSLYDQQLQWRINSRHEYSRLQKWLRNAEAIDAKKKEVESSATWQQIYDSSTGGSVAAMIQRDVSNVLGAIGATNVSSQPLESISEESLVRHGVRVSASMDTEQLRATFSVLHSHLPYLRISAIQVMSPAVQSHNMNPLMTITMDVIGYSRAEKLQHKDSGGV